MLLIHPRQGRIPLIDPPQDKAYLSQTRLRTAYASHIPALVQSCVDLLPPTGGFDRKVPQRNRFVFEDLW